LKKNPTEIWGASPPLLSSTSLMIRILERIDHYSKTTPQNATYCYILRYRVEMYKFLNNSIMDKMVAKIEFHNSLKRVLTKKYTEKRNHFDEKLNQNFEGMYFGIERNY
jgi:hypothetical protein